MLKKKNQKTEQTNKKKHHKTPLSPQTDTKIAPLYTGHIWGVIMS